MLLLELGHVPLHALARDGAVDAGTAPGAWPASAFRATGACWAAQPAAPRPRERVAVSGTIAAAVVGVAVTPMPAGGACAAAAAGIQVDGIAPSVFCHAARVRCAGLWLTAASRAGCNGDGTQDETGVCSHVATRKDDCGERASRLSPCTETIAHVPVVRSPLFEAAGQPPSGNRARTPTAAFIRDIGLGLLCRNATTGAGATRSGVASTVCKVGPVATSISNASNVATTTCASSSCSTDAECCKGLPLRVESSVGASKRRKALSRASCP